MDTFAVDTLTSSAVKVTDTVLGRRCGWEDRRKAGRETDYPSSTTWCSSILTFSSPPFPQSLHESLI